MLHKLGNPFKIFPRKKIMYGIFSIIIFICFVFSFPVSGKGGLQKSNPVDNVLNLLISKKQNLNKNSKLNYIYINNVRSLLEERTDNSSVTENPDEADPLLTEESVSNDASTDTPLEDSEYEQSETSIFEAEMTTVVPMEDTTVNSNYQHLVSQEVLSEIIAFITSLQANNIEVETLLNEIESNKPQENVPSLSDLQTIQLSNQKVMNDLTNLLSTITYNEDGNSFSSPQVENLRQHLLELEKSSQLMTSEINLLHNLLTSLSSDINSMKQQSEELKAIILEASEGYKSVENVFQELHPTKQTLEELIQEIRQLRLQP